MNSTEDESYLRPTPTQLARSLGWELDVFFSIVSFCTDLSRPCLQVGSIYGIKISIMRTPYLLEFRVQISHQISTNFEEIKMGSRGLSSSSTFDDQSKLANTIYSVCLRRFWSVCTILGFKLVPHILLFRGLLSWIIHSVPGGASHDREPRKVERTGTFQDESSVEREYFG